METFLKVPSGKFKGQLIKLDHYNERTARREPIGGKKI